jgi:Tol biopolymer transport system component
MTRTANFTVSQNGILAFKSTGATSGNADEQRAIIWYDRSGSIAGQAPGTGMYVGMDFAPDGRRFVVHRHEGTGGDIWSYDFDAKRFQRLTFDASQENSSPVWSPDGTRIAFASRRGGNWGLYVKRADGTGAEELITESPAAKAAMSWSPDGKFIVYNQTADIWAVPLDGDKKPIPLVTTGATEILPQVSPDGKWLAYQSNETGRQEIYVKPFPSGPGRWQISTDGGIWPRWRADGGEIYFVAAPNIVAASIKVTGNSIEAATPVSVLTLAADPSVASHETSYHRFAVSKDGSRFLLGQPAGVSTATGGISDRIATLADGSSGTADGPASNLTVVVNWPRLLKRN